CESYGAPPVARNHMKLSLLSAVRNEGAFIEEMIASVVSQSHTDWELLFVDDGSTDQTVEIIEYFAAQDERIILVDRQPASGKVSAFNKAFEASRGDVICIHGGDDVSRAGAFVSRLKPFADGDGGGKAAFFKLRSFSEDPRFDG